MSLPTVSKSCKVCRCTKPVSDFNLACRTDAVKKYYTSYCKTCNNIRRKGLYTRRPTGIDKLDDIKKLVVMTDISTLIRDNMPKGELKRIALKHDIQQGTMRLWVSKVRLQTTPSANL